MDRLANDGKKLFFGFTQLQFLILVATMAQNSGYVLIRRYSQGVIKESASSSAVGVPTSRVILYVDQYHAFFCDRLQIAR